MSSQISENRNFLHLLLNTHPDQKKALLLSVTPSQASALREIFFNILNREHSLADQKFVKRKIPLIRKLSKNKKSAKAQQTLVRKERLMIIKTLDHFKQQLEEII